MLRPDLLRWQFDRYADGHTTRQNLAIHLVGVPLFQMGFVTFVMGLVSWSGFSMMSGWVVAATSLFLQNVGHGKERVAPIPFDGALDGVSRLLVEQWVTFPKFVLTGGWVRAWRKATS